MTKQPHRHAGAAAWLGATLIGLAACDGGPADRLSEPAAAVQADDRQAWAGPGTATRTSNEPARTRALPDARAEMEVATTASARGAARASLGAVAWQAVGEMDLPDGRVERQYRVRFVNGPTDMSAVQAELVVAGHSLEIVRGRLDLGDLAPGASVSPAGAVTMRHAPDHPIDLAELQWHWHEHASPAARFGRLLGGPAEQLATQALRAVDEPRPAGPAQLAAILAPDATAGIVNQALRSANLRIAAMRPGNHTLTLNLVAGGSGAGSVQSAQQALSAGTAFVQVRVLPARLPAAATPEAWHDAEAAAKQDAAADAACAD